MSHFEDLAEQLRRNPATADLLVCRSVDLYDDVWVGALAGRLLTRFRDGRVVRAERDACFGLLLRTTCPILEEAAVAAAERWGLAKPSDELLDVFFAGLSGRSTPRDVRPARFLDDACACLNVLARDATRILGDSAPGVPLASLLDDRDVLDELSGSLSELDSDAFHSLDLLDRQVLMYRVVDELSEADTAERLDIPLEEVEPRCDAALRAFDAAQAEFVADAAAIEPPSAADPEESARRLADLAYEGVKCLAMHDPVFRDRVTCQRAPRKARSIAREVASLRGLHGLLREQQETLHCVLGERRPAAWMVDELLRLLVRVEGRSGRHLLTWAHVVMCRGEWTQGFAMVEPCAMADAALRTPLGLAFARACLKLSRYERLERFIDEERDNGYGGPILELYAVAADAFRGRRRSAWKHFDRIDWPSLDWTEGDRMQAELLTGHVAQSLGVERSVLDRRLALVDDDPA